jgi:catechol 2,3-dioxygenase-like lactoylglutathione lyase family enzyme
MKAPAILLAFASIGAAQLQPPNDAGIRMGHLHLNVHDIDAQKKFWVDLFGAKPLQREGLTGVKLPGMLILFRQQDPTGASEGTVLDHFGVKVIDLADILRRCQAAGFKTLPIHTGSEGFPNGYVYGPDGVKIELQQDTALTTPVISHHLHYFVDDPLALRAWYVKTFSFTSGIRGRHQSADVPGMNLSFQPVKPQPSIGTKGRTLDHIGFEVRNLEAFCKNLETNGVKLDSPYRKLPNLGIAMAFLTDPQGVLIELTEGLEKY